ncbi:MAG: AAA family ATPase, partial [Polyangiaceae bacterium]|nr:AAA family ATPase [Polyangiaceae bacterium]
DVHETIAGFKEDMPGPVAASAGIVRGIASGVRDARGQLAQYVLHEPAAHLAGVLGRAAAPGCTWVAGGVYRLVRRDFRWGDLPSLRLDPAPNVDAPPALRVYALERSLSREERLDAQGGATDLVGRDVEKADLHAAFHEALRGPAGGGQLVARAVVGEMGIGKTAVVATFLAELPPNARLLHVECTPVTMEVPHAAVAELVRQAIGTSGEEPFDQVARLIAHAGSSTPWDDASSPIVARLAELATNQMGGNAEADAHTRKKQIVAGVRNLLSAIAFGAPLVVVVEGMHWGDKASLEAIGELVHSNDPLPVFVVLVSRPDDRVVHVTEGLVRIELRGLTPDEQVRLVETRFGVREGARQVCADLLPKVGGNPFFLLEMLEALLERGGLEIREEIGPGGERVATLARTGRDDAELTALPSTLEQLLGDRIRELPPAEHAIVDWLAIAGGPLPAADVIRLAGHDGDEALVRLCARGVCDRRGEAVDFRHALTREVAYVALDGDDRVRMHRALGEHLAKTSLGRGLTAAIVARHLARGASYDRAADFYLEAAAAARAAYQIPLGIRYLLRAMAYLDSVDPRRVVVHESLESLYRMLGRRQERLRHLKALRQVARHFGTPRAACLGLLRTARFEFDEGRLARGVVVAEQAARIARAVGLPSLEMEAEARLSECLRELGDVHGALAACDRALLAFGPGGAERAPPQQRGEVLRLRGMLLLRIGRVREAVEAYIHAAAIFKKCGRRRLEARVKSALSCAMFVRGRYEDAIALALESIQIDLSIGVRFQVARALTNVGQSYFRLGDVDRALAYLKRAREVHERYGDQNGWAETLLVSASIATELGDTGGAEVFVRDAAALTAATGNAYDGIHERIVRAALERARGNTEAALTHARDARVGAESMSLLAFHGYALAIEAAGRADAGEHEAATDAARAALAATLAAQGCEYGLEIWALCADAMRRAGDPEADRVRARAVTLARELAASVENPRLHRLFEKRPAHAALLALPQVPSPPKAALMHGADGTEPAALASQAPETA